MPKLLYGTIAYRPICVVSSRELPSSVGPAADHLQDISARMPCMQNSLF